MACYFHGLIVFLNYYAEPVNYRVYFEVHLNTGRIQFVSEIYSEEIKCIICSITNLFVA